MKRSLTVPAHVMTVMSSISRIPSELVDNLIDLGDRRTLISCSSVCKSWLPRSRHALFRHLRVVVNPSNSGAFLQLVEHPLSTLSAHIYILDITRDHGGGGEYWFKDILPRITILASALKSLVLTLANFVTLAADLHPKFWSTFKALTQIRFDRCRFLSFVQFIDVLSALPHLEHLSVVDLSCRDDDPSPIPQRGGNTYTSTSQVSSAYRLWERGDIGLVDISRRAHAPYQRSGVWHCLSV